MGTWELFSLFNKLYDRSPFFPAGLRGFLLKNAKRDDRPKKIDHPNIFIAADAEVDCFA